MGGATREFYLATLRESLELLRHAGSGYLVIGSVATRAHLGEPLSEAEDIDVLIRREDAARLLADFADLGFATHHRDETWIYKAARPDVTVDLIFRAGETIELDRDHLDRAASIDVDGLALRVPGAEDLSVMKAIFDGPLRRGKWYEVIELLRVASIDWDYLAQRGAAHGPRRILSLLLYALDEGISVPDEALFLLMSNVEDRIEAVATRRGDRRGTSLAR